MKTHYINILLFALPLNILVHNQRNHKNTTHHTPKIPTTRLLCECDLYMPNYNNEPQMKSVMENFNKQTQQRFHEYDDRMVEKRKRCKDKCDKEIQKIILKDKLEKQMAEQFATLHTDIQSDSIPTCFCEKSLADKVEKGCLRCGSVFGGGVVPSVGLLGGIGQLGLDVWKTAAIKTATKEAISEATKAAMQEGMKAVSLKIEGLSKSFFKADGFVDLSSIVNKLTYKNGDALVEAAKKVIGEACKNERGNLTSFYNTTIRNTGELNIKNFAEAGRSAFKTTLASKTEEFEAANLATVDATYGGCQTAIIASIVAILVIVLIMVIIYLILRYGRKKKMKKKLQYIKLLKE
ncbi:rifin PIR protein, putative [Plasmodium reichenowi]|uniref:Rifin PIR protein, putative n=1 Tax=Plasmodium reichenowi TaxID=5854 RepID=A0A2P9D9P6_PLARE|nr:rifin PIR protein, putative [Plasmodium reichenowi]